MWKRLMAVAIALFTAGSLLVATPASAATTDNTKLAERLLTKFFTMLHNQDTQGLSTFLSPAFQVERADGTGSDKTAYLAAIPKVSTIELSDLVVTRVGDSLVTRYKAIATETINGQVLKKDPAPRLTVFVVNKKSGKWQVLAHANFNSIAPTAAQ